MSLIFLGGTCANNNWREEFTKQLIAYGVPEHAIFNPVVSDWTEEARLAEKAAKEDPANVLLFYITDPQQEDHGQLSTYSIFEAQKALYTSPGRTVVVFDKSDLEGHALKVMNQIAFELENDFPDALIFENPVLAVAPIYHLAVALDHRHLNKLAEIVDI